MSALWFFAFRAKEKWQHNRHTTTIIKLYYLPWPTHMHTCCDCYVKRNILHFALIASSLYHHHHLLARWWSLQFAPLLHSTNRSCLVIYALLMLASLPACQFIGYSSDCDYLFCAICICSSFLNRWRPELYRSYSLHICSNF